MIDGTHADHMKSFARLLVAMNRTELKSLAQKLGRELIENVIEAERNTSAGNENLASTCTGSSYWQA